jgi:hypothetical protein
MYDIFSLTEDLAYYLRNCKDDFYKKHQELDKTI